MLFAFRPTSSPAFAPAGNDAASSATGSAKRYRPLGTRRTLWSSAEKHKTLRSYFQCFEDLFSGSAGSSAAVGVAVRRELREENGVLRLVVVPGQARRGAFPVD